MNYPLFFMKCLVFLVLIAATGCTPAAAPDNALTPAIPSSPVKESAPPITATAPGATPTTPGDTSPIDPTPLAYPPPHQTSPLFSPLETPFQAPLDPYWEAAGVELAIADLAGRLEITTDSIEVITISPDEFPGGDMGCPNPKEPASISPSMVTGYLVVLGAGGESYEYHTRNGRIAYCGKQ